VGLWRWPSGAGDDGPSVRGQGRIVAVHAKTGAVLANVPVAGAPAHLLLAPLPGQAGLRLYSVQQVPGPVRSDDADRYYVPQSWELWALDPATLEVLRVYPLDQRLLPLAASPDGDHLYALADHQAVSPGMASTSLLYLDLNSGAVHTLTEVPGVALGLAVTGERIYVLNSFGAEVWAFDRRAGRLLQTIPVGRGPTGIAASGPQAIAGNVD
jgi:hypothetical protein